MQTIGERLEEARKKKGISIREAAEATKIRGDYLQKFESNHFDIGLTEIYTRGFLRTYSNFLKLPADRIINDYAALGRGDVRPRQPNREVYGRMDISVAKAGDAAELPAKPDETTPVSEPHPHSPRPVQNRSRAATSLPTGPDPAVVFRYIKWGAIGLVAIVVLLIIINFFSGRKNEGAGRQAAPPPRTQSEPVATLVATGRVQVTVHAYVSETQTKTEKLFDRTMQPNERFTIARRGGLLFKAVPPENFGIELDGTLHPLTKLAAPGVNEIVLRAP